MKYIPEKIKKVSIRWFHEAPFFNEFLLRFSYRKDESIPTAGVGYNKNKKVVDFIFNEEWVNSLDDSKLEGLLVHEIMHLTAFNQQRRNNRHHKLWNVATDVVNNEEIIESSIGSKQLQLPESGCFLEPLQKKGYEGRCVAEDVYDFLYDNAIEITPFDMHNLLEELEDSDEAKALIEEMTENAKAHSYGSISGSLSTMIKGMIERPKVNIYKIIRNKLNSSVSKGDRVKYNTWNKKNRRGLPFPGKNKYSKRVQIFVDTSGSCYNEEIFKKFFAEIDSLSKRVKEIYLHMFDTKLKKSITYKKGAWQKLPVDGGGGTDVQPIFNYLQENEGNKDVVVILTDGMFSWNIENYGVRPYWIFINSNVKANFGYSYNIEE